ncbi:MAG: 16S rRNA (guanine(527)-N(7))-methyltransferase RsmG [Eubacterium sp.]|nr:16S rRNA (guanine(527)-N(7))-methyltransferase RsmG [Eubacterium sp.]
MKNDLLKKSLDNLSINCSNEIIDQFDHYYDLLIDWNKKINLTAITEYDDVISKHFIDSILVSSFVDLNGKKIIDIGTGAGFPGIPIKILFPETELVLLDSLNKRVRFLEEVINKLSLKNVRIIHGRAEDLAHNKELRASFDIALSRAVANLSTLSEYCIPFIKKGGLFVSYKSGNADEEIKDAENAVGILGSRIISVNDCILPETDILRKFVIIEKINDVSNKYPRRAGTPAKDPL